MNLSKCIGVLYIIILRKFSKVNALKIKGIQKSSFYQIQEKKRCQVVLQSVDVKVNKTRLVVS